MEALGASRYYRRVLGIKGKDIYKRAHEALSGMMPYLEEDGVDVETLVHRWIEVTVKGITEAVCECIERYHLKTPSHWPDVSMERFEPPTLGWSYIKEHTGGFFQFVKSDIKPTGDERTAVDVNYVEIPKEERGAYGDKWKEVRTASKVPAYHNKPVLEIIQAESLNVIQDVLDVIEIDLNARIEVFRNASAVLLLGLRQKA